jgi:glycosyltransferase involved in cell wall biosynthesis
MRTLPQETPELSVVVPMFNESEHVGLVIDAISEHVGAATESFEIVAVDDGSSDDTWERLAAESARRPRLRAIRLSRNFGKEHALTAGLEASRGRGVLVMDGDLQHPPALVPEMVARWRAGTCDVVEAVKRTRGTESLRSKVGAGAFYGLLKMMSGFDLRGASDFKLLDRRVVDAWRQMPERNLFFRGMIAWLGFRRERVVFDVAERVGGTSKWSLFALVRLAVGAVTAFSSTLLQVVTFVGVLFLMFALALAAHTLMTWFQGHAVTGFATVILLLLMVGSLLMISLGLIGLYLARIYDEVKARPRFVVAEAVGFDPESDNGHTAEGSARAPAGRMARDDGALAATGHWHPGSKAREFDDGNKLRNPNASGARDLPVRQD